MAHETVSMSSRDCSCHTESLTDIDADFDGQWQGITAASDGNCYFASSTHSYRRGAGFFRFEPATKKLSTIAEDMTAVCGDDLTKTPPQGKIHSPIVEVDGWLYFATHLANYWTEAINAYPGAHVLGYEIATGEFRDFGVLRTRFTIYSAVGVDPERKQIYAFVVPWSEDDIANDGCHVYRIDIATGTKKDLGRVVPNAQGVCFWFFVDKAGDCWFSLWTKGRYFPYGGHGHLHRIHGDTGEIELVEDTLPDCRVSYPDGQCLPGSDEVLADRAWTWAAALPGSERCLFLMGRGGGNDERLWVFSPPSSSPSGDMFRSVGLVGPTFLPVALGGNRVYYVQRGDLRRQREWSAEAERDRDPESVGWKQAIHAEDLHLKSISLHSADEGAVTDHGRIVDQNGRAPRHIDSLAADQEGRVYAVGSWHLLPGDTATRQVVWDKPTREFHVVKRSQRFAFFDLRESVAANR